jgi:hypothetical protein
MCKSCDVDPKSHSFFRIATEDNVQIFYSCPSEATKYFDKQSVEIHCREKLQEKGDTCKWIFIFDGTGYTLRHAMAIGVSLSFLRVIKEHADTLLEIRILNTSSYVSTMLTIMKPFIPHNIYSKINWNTMN